MTQLKFGDPLFDKNKIFRTTKCFSPATNGYPGGFPVGFLNWVHDMGWWGKKRCYLCCGQVDDLDSVRVDLSWKANATHVEDARETSLPDLEFDWVMIDPPYSRELADKLYGMGEYYSSINMFTKEAERICGNGGLILTLSYEVPKRIKNCDLVACVGVYQAINVCHMRCCSVWKKR